MNKKKLVIIGAGGHGKVCANVAEEMNKWDEIVFLDDHKQGSINGHKIIGKIDLDTLPKPNADFFVGIGNKTLREKFTLMLKSLNASMATIIHPSANISQYHAIGEGTIVMPKVVINVDVRIGSSVIINTGAIIEHDVSIDDFTHVSPGVILTGNVNIGQSVWIGSGAIAINGVKICDDVIIGANSLVAKCIDESGTYVGNPVKKIN